MARRLCLVAGFLVLVFAGCTSTYSGRVETNTTVSTTLSAQTSAAAPTAAAPTAAVALEDAANAEVDLERPEPDVVITAVAGTGNDRAASDALDFNQPGNDALPGSAVHVATFASDSGLISRPLLHFHWKVAGGWCEGYSGGASCIVSAVPNGADPGIDGPPSSTADEPRLSGQSSTDSYLESLAVGLPDDTVDVELVTEFGVVRSDAIEGMAFLRWPCELGAPQSLVVYGAEGLTETFDVRDQSCR